MLTCLFVYLVVCLFYCPPLSFVSVTGRYKTLICTDVAARGVDLGNVDLVSVFFFSSFFSFSFLFSFLSFSFFFFLFSFSSLLLFFFSFFSFHPFFFFFLSFFFFSVLLLFLFLSFFFFFSLCFFSFLLFSSLCSFCFYNPCFLLAFLRLMLGILLCVDLRPRAFSSAPPPLNPKP